MLPTKFIFWSVDQKIIRPNQGYNLFKWLNFYEWINPVSSGLLRRHDLSISIVFFISKTRIKSSWMVTRHTPCSRHFFFDTLFLHKFFLLTKEITNRRNYLPTCVLIRFYLSRMVGISYVSCAVSVTNKWMSCLVLIEWQQWCHNITYNTIDWFIRLLPWRWHIPHQPDYFFPFPFWHISVNDDWCVQTILVLYVFSNIIWIL